MGMRIFVNDDDISSMILMEEIIPELPSSLL